MSESSSSIIAAAAADEDAAVHELDAQSSLALVELAVTPEGEEFIVGDRWQGNFVSLPEIAIVVIDAIRAGHRLGKVAAIAGEHAGVEVDVLDFANTLIELGFVTHIDGTPLGSDGTRRYDGGRFGQRLAQLAGPFFSRPAWALYATLFVACSILLISVPAYRPHAKQLFFLHNPLASVAVLTVFDSIIVGAHELAHWLAARVQGVPARITISRRLYILVFETDLSAIWSLPRRKRFGPLLAGIAFHTVLLSMLLAARVTAHAGLWHPSALIARLVAALVILAVTGLAFQCFIFLRTDLYGLLAIGLGCLNLTRINQLLIKRSVRGLSSDEASELAQAHAQDVRIASYYRWLYLAGLAFASAYFFAFFLPWILTLGRWIATGVAHSAPTQPHFWETLVLGALAVTPFLLPLLMFVRDNHQRLRGLPRVSRRGVRGSV